MTSPSSPDDSSRADTQVDDERSQRFKTAFELAPIGMAIGDTNGTFVQVNDALCTFLGYSQDEILGLSFTAITHPDDMEATLARAKKLLAGELPPYQLEKRYVRKDGSVVWGLLSVSTVRDAEGNPLYVISQVQDLTEHRKDKETIEARELQLIEAQRLARVGSWDWDMTSDTITWSAPLYSVFGLDPADGPLSYERYLPLVHPDDREHLEAVVARGMETGEGWEVEYRTNRPDQSVGWIFGRGRVILGPDGPIRMRGTAQDITERKEAEEERGRLREELSRAQRLEAIGRLAGGVAHDFNNMLTAILGYSDLLLSQLEPESPLRAETLQIQRAARQASQLPRQLLAFSRNVRLEPKLIDIRDVIAEASDLLDRLSGEAVEVIVSANPSALVLADPAQIEHILVNLVLNARDAMPAGGRVVISTASAEIDEATAAAQNVARGGYVVVSVTDSGEGIDEETLARLFEPFFTTKPQGQGVGLGLASVHGIVSQSDGFVTVASTVGRGARFEVFLPRVGADGLPSGPAADSPATASPATPVTKTILLAEDEPVVRELVTTVLESAGFTVIAGKDGLDALALWDTTPGIDAVVSDVVMPRLGGRELAERILQSAPDTAVVFMSGYASEAPAASGDGDPPQLLRKPFAPAALISAVTDALQRAALRAAARGV